MSLPSFFKSRFQVLSEIWAEVRHGKEAKIAGGVYAAAATGYGLLITFAPHLVDRAHKIPTIAALLSLRSWLILALVMLLLLSLEGAYRVVAKTRKDEELPKIEVVIRAAFINPLPDGVANCFLSLMLRSSSDEQCSNPGDYSVTLTIKGKRYSQSAFLVLSGYRLSQYRAKRMYDSDGHEFEGEERIGGGSLPDIRSKSDKLAKGSPITGWLGVALYGLPPWPYREEVIGQHLEVSESEDEQHGQEVWVDDVERTTHTGSVQAVTVALIDAYGQLHEAQSSGPFESQDQRISELGKLGDAFQSHRNL